MLVCTNMSFALVMVDFLVYSCDYHPFENSTTYSIVVLVFVDF